MFLDYAFYGTAKSGDDELADEIRSIRREWGLTRELDEDIVALTLDGNVTAVMNLLDSASADRLMEFARQATKFHCWDIDKMNKVRLLEHMILKRIVKANS